MLGLPKTGGLPVRERALIDHGLKWWPTKKYAANLTDNGTSANWRLENWRLEINSLTRAEATYPAEGVPFALILTIEDASGQRPIFQTFRQYLQTRPIAIDDIRTTYRIRQRAQATRRVSLRFLNDQRSQKALAVTHCSAPQQSRLVPQ